MSITSFLYHKAEHAFLHHTGRTASLGGRTYRSNRFLRIPGNINAAHESWSDKAYRTALALRDGLFVDVGVNTGQTLRRILGMDAKRAYLGFEPQAECVCYIKKFIDQNHLTNHKILPVGLSNREGPVQLFLRKEDGDSTASMVEGFRPDEFYSRTDFIYVAKGDRILREMQLSPCAIIKIDVEGGELEAIEGLSDTLNDHRPFVFFEVLNYFLFVTGRELTEEMIKFREKRNAALMDLFKKLKYDVFNMRDPDTLLETKEFRPQRIADLSVCDYVAIPSESTSEFLEYHDQKKN